MNAGPGEAAGPCGWSPGGESGPYRHHGGAPAECAAGAQIHARPGMCLEARGRVDRRQSIPPTHSYDVHCILLTYAYFKDWFSDPSWQSTAAHDTARHAQFLFFSQTCPLRTCYLAHMYAQLLGKSNVHKLPALVIASSHKHTHAHKYTLMHTHTHTTHTHTHTHAAPTASQPNLQGRLTKDIGKLMAERAELADRVASLQASVYKANEKLDGFKLLMNWNQEEMEQWALAQRQKEEDNAALDKYKKQDAAKV
eukprot:scaffold113534_cov20-Tisochrysis_lutea.AAC.1